LGSVSPRLRAGRGSRHPAGPAGGAAG